MFLFYITVIISLTIITYLVQISLVLIARTAKYEYFKTFEVFCEINLNKDGKLDFYQQCVNNSIDLHLTNSFIIIFILI